MHLIKSLADLNIEPSNLSSTEKMEFCKKCAKFNGMMCTLTSCSSAFKEIINSRFGKCPDSKW